MKDRIPTYAGRIRLTPVENQPNVYDTERADEPIQEGTPLNAQNLLSDETAELLGFSQDSTPNDAFVALLEKINNGSKIQTGSYVGTGENSKTLTFDFTPKIVIVQASDSSGAGTVIFLYGCKEAFNLTYESSSDLVNITKAGWTETSLRMSSARSLGESSSLLARDAFNSTDTPYNYTAIG